MIKELENIAKELNKIKKIDAIFLFGSYALEKSNSSSDIDICIFGNLSEGDKSHISLEFPEKYDISFFEELPIWIKTRVLKEGKPLLIKNEKALIEVAFKTMHEWEDFRPTLNKLIMERFGKCMT